MSKDEIKISEAAEKVAKAKKESKAKSDKSGKPNIFVRIGKGIKRFCKDFRGELKKIVWPSSKEVIKSTGVVLLVVVLIGSCIWLVDFGLSKLLGLIMGIAEKQGQTGAEAVTTAAAAFINLKNLF